MKEAYSNLLRLILSAGLTERELFVDKISAFISERSDTDPDRSRHIAEAVMGLVAALKDELLLRQLFARQAASAADAATAGEPPRGQEAPAAGAQAGQQELIERIEQLNRTLEELNRTLNEKQP